MVERCCACGREDVLSPWCLTGQLPEGASSAEEELRWLLRDFSKTDKAIKALASAESARGSEATGTNRTRDCPRADPHGAQPAVAAVSDSKQDSHWSYNVPASTEDALDRWLRAVRLRAVTSLCATDRHAVLAPDWPHTGAVGSFRLSSCE